MYTVTVTRDFTAQHYLTVPDPGPEGTRHAHHYEIEVTVRGPDLNEHNYLLDIDDVKDAMASIEARYADVTLNERSEFEGNPSVERFARVISDRLLAALDTEGLEGVAVRVWEGDEAAAGYERSL